MVKKESEVRWSGSDRDGAHGRPWRTAAEDSPKGAIPLRERQRVRARGKVESDAERIKMPKRGVNWAFLKIRCKK
jgi:hypothetical protein